MRFQYVVHRMEYGTKLGIRMIIDPCCGLQMRVQRIIPCGLVCRKNHKLRQKVMKDDMQRSITEAQKEMYSNKPLGNRFRWDLFDRFGCGNNLPISCWLDGRSLLQRLL